MSLRVGDVLEVDDDALIKQGCHRVVFVDVPLNAAHVMALGRPWKLPIKVCLDQLQTAVDSPEASVRLAPDKYLRLRTDKAKKHGEKKKNIAWYRIGPLVRDDQVWQLFDPALRGDVIDQRAKKLRVAVNSIYRHLHAYWARGMTPKALLPDYENCGAPGTRRVGRARTGDHVDSTDPSSKPESSGPDSANSPEAGCAEAEVKPIDAGKPASPRIGRPYSQATISAGGVVRDFNTSAEDRGIFQTAIDKLYAHYKGSLKLIYDRMVETMYLTSFEAKNGILVPVPRPARDVPSFAMFKGWYESLARSLKRLKQKLGIVEFQKNFRSLHGRARERVLGPGSRYQIDATLADVYLVNGLRRNLIIGRPVLYIVYDTWSTMIVGLYVGLHGPSWDCARLALKNAFLPKVRWCAQYGVYITEADWPCDIVCSVLLADRQEMLSNAAATLTEHFRIDIESAPAYRADLKMIESRFRLLNLVSGIKWIPGAVAERVKEWGGRDYRLDAVLDLKEFTNIVIRAVIFYNKYHHCPQHRLTDPVLAATSFPATPINFWNFGLSEGLGTLRRGNEDICRAALLPHVKAKITEGGIEVGDLLYRTQTDLLTNRYDFVRSEQKTEYVNVGVDSEWPDEVWLRNGTTGMYEAAVLREDYSTFKGQRSANVIDLSALNKVTPETLVDERRRASAADDALTDDMVKKATAAGKSATAGKSNASRLSNIGENRRQADAEERARVVKEAYSSAVLSEQAPAQSRAGSVDAEQSTASCAPKESSQSEAQAQQAAPPKPAGPSDDEDERQYESNIFQLLPRNKGQRDA